MLPRERPEVRGFRAPVYGMLTLAMLPGIIVFVTLQSLVPVLAHGTELWLASILPVIASAGFLLMILLVGLKGGRHWYGPLAQGLAWLLMGAFAAAVALSLAVLLRLVPEASPQESFVSGINIVLWLLLAPANFMLWRVTQDDAWRRLPSAADPALRS